MKIQHIKIFDIKLKPSINNVNFPLKKKKETKYNKKLSGDDLNILFGRTEENVKRNVNLSGHSNHIYHEGRRQLLG